MPIELYPTKTPKYSDVCSRRNSRQHYSYNTIYTWILWDRLGWKDLIEPI